MPVLVDRKTGSHPMRMAIRSHRVPQSRHLFSERAQVLEVGFENGAFTNNGGESSRWEFGVRLARALVTVASSSFASTVCRFEGSEWVIGGMHLEQHEADQDFLADGPNPGRRTCDPPARSGDPGALEAVDARRRDAAARRWRECLVTATTGILLLRRPVRSAYCRRPRGSER